MPVRCMDQLVSASYYIAQDEFGAHLRAGAYIQPKHIIPGWWIWVYWINPMAWAQQSLAINEFK